MMVQSSRRHLLINKEDIINYQYEILEQSTPLAKPTISNTNKYSLWDLDSKIREVVGDSAHSIRWIGNSQTAYLETYAYIMLIAASHSQANIVQFKHIIYKFGRQCLNLPQQKLLVEFLCLIEYSRDRYAFLNKYPQIQALLIKILQFVQDDSPPSDDSAQEKKKAKVRRKTSGKTLQRSLQKKEQHINATHRQKNSQSQQTESEKQLEQIYSEFNKHFQFISLLGSNEYSCSLKLFQTKKIYVVIEKECYFMVEVSQKINKTYLQFTLGNKYMNENNKEVNHSEIEAIIKEFDQKVYFNHEELDTIMGYHNQVQESKVIPIQRASQIRSPLNNRFGYSDSKKEHLQIYSEPRHSYVHTLADKSQAEFDKTFIDQLITNPALNTQKEINKQQTVINDSRLPAHIINKKQKIMDKMVEFKKMKQAIQGVRQRIEGKLKKIDQVEHLKSEMSPKMIEKRQSHNQTDKSGVYRKDDQITHLFNQASVKFKLQAIANRKNSLNVPTSLQSLPEPKNLEELLVNHKSQHKIPQETSLKNGKYLSQKAYSRPESKIKSPQDERTYSPKFKTMIPRKGSLDVAVIQPLSPNNVNVNVNVSINENLLNPRYTSPSSSFLKQHLQKYATNKPTNRSQPWFAPNYKRQQTPPNFYNYNMQNQEKSLNTANQVWNGSKTTGFYGRKLQS